MTHVAPLAQTTIKFPVCWPFYAANGAVAVASGQGNAVILNADLQVQREIAGKSSDICVGLSNDAGTVIFWNGAVVWAIDVWSGVRLWEPKNRRLNCGAWATASGE